VPMFDSLQPASSGPVLPPDAQDDVEMMSMIRLGLRRLIGIHHAPRAWYCAQLLPWPHVWHRVTLVVARRGPAVLYSATVARWHVAREYGMAFVHNLTRRPPG
jgi:hypothetical protein